jgi:type II secretory pathway predicted ATPase ExeA
MIRCRYWHRGSEELEPESRRSLRVIRDTDANDWAGVQPLAADESIRLVAHHQQDGRTLRRARVACERNPRCCGAERAGHECLRVRRRVEPGLTPDRDREVPAQPGALHDVRGDDADIPRALAPGVADADRQAGTSIVTDEVVLHWRHVRYNLRVHADSPASAAVSYDLFFGFHHTPFSLAPDTRFVFQSASHRDALAQVTYALERREPVVVVTGEIGTGKTLLCRTVLKQLGRKTFVATIDDPRLERDDLLKQILLDFGVMSKDRTTWTPTSRHDLVHALQDFLSSIAPLHAHAAVIIDEAQHVQPDVLEDLRLIANVQNERGTLLQLILIGQKSLEELLARPELRQLQQRVSRYVRLDPLTATEVANYIDHRLAVARQRQVQSTFPGASELSREIAEWQLANADSTFTPEAVRAVATLSQGIPRVVNLLCDRALEAAYAQQSRIVDEPFITAAAHALGLPAVSGELTTPPSVAANDESVAVDAAAATEPSTATVGRRRLYALVAGAVVVAIAAVWFGQRRMNPADQGGTNPRMQRPVQPATAAPPAPVAAAPPANQTQSPAPSAPTASAPPAATATASPPAGDVFEIVVASFRTTARANDVAAQVAALGEPVRLRATAGWQQVIAGPYQSKDQGQDAQQRLTQAGFTGSHLGPATR